MAYDAQPPTKRIKKSIMVQYFHLDIIVGILAMLPVRTLQRFRCVCKSWNALIQQDSYFAVQHSNTQSNSKKRSSVSLSLPFFRDFYRLNYHPHGSEKIHKIDFSRAPQKYRMTNSCCGLVGVYAHYSFFVANPSIMKLAELPRGSPHVQVHPGQMPMAAIGFDSSAAGFKAVRLFARKYESYRLANVGCEVFSLGGGRSWKPVNDPPVLRYMGVDLCCVLDGAVYWTVGFELVRPGFTKPEIALSFDMREERFSVLLHPERNSRPKCSKVLVVGGCLSIADRLDHPEQMNVWTLKDGKNSVWVKQYSIDLSNVYETLGISSLWVHPLTIDGRKIVLLYVKDGTREYYDPQTMSFIEGVKVHDADCEFLTPYTESVVWPWLRFCN